MEEFFVRVKDMVNNNMPTAAFSWLSHHAWEAEIVVAMGSLVLGDENFGKKGEFLREGEESSRQIHIGSSHQTKIPQILLHYCYCNFRRAPCINYLCCLSFP